MGRPYRGTVKCMYCTVSALGSFMDKTGVRSYACSEHALLAMAAHAGGEYEGLLEKEDEALAVLRKALPAPELSDKSQEKNDKRGTSFDL